MEISTTKRIQQLLGLFADELLSSQDKIDCSLCELASSMIQDHCEPLVERLLRPPATITRPLLELVLSSRECGQQLSQWLLLRFPLISKGFSVTQHAVLLSRLSMFLLFAYPFERDIATTLSNYRTRVEHVARAIEILETFVKPLESQDGEILEEDDLSSFVTVKRSQRQRKAIAKKITKPLFDASAQRILDIFHIATPTDEADASTKAASLLDLQYEILKFYLGTLQRPEVASYIRQQYIPQSIDIASLELDSNNHQGDLSLTSDNNQLPVAFPMVQPMKAALYFDSAEGFGEWRILISTRADRDLREARRKDAKFFRIIIKKIKELSNGHFSDDNQKRLNHGNTNTEIPIYEAKMTRDSRLIYQIDCIPEYDAEVERQVIKIFGVYTHAQIDKRLWNSVGCQLSRKGKEYRHRCTFRNRPHHAGDNVFIPACFPPPDQPEEEEYSPPQLPEENLEEMHSLLVLEKFVTFSQALLNSIIADLDVAHVFNVTPQEKEIIEYPYSCYVLGRSGTGKTTTMLFKMLGIERAYLMRKDSMPKPRQVFVTQSRVLAGKVEEYFCKLLDSLSTAEKTREELAQLVSKRRLQQDEEGLIDLDDDQNWHADLPSKFSQLQDDHFPLFITFDRLVTLLEADMTEPGHSAKEQPEPADSNPSHTGLINYNTFLITYWPHFSQSLRKGLDPALVFSELMGVIQGSEDTLNHENRYLDKQSYEALSHRAQYAFASRRDTIYSIFRLYLKQKCLAGQHDAADRTHRVLKTIQAAGPPGQKLDYLYVDEAQDNLLIDAFLLRALVRNPDGLFWAGDTAQTISVGSSFRFNDLKAFLFRLEKRREGNSFESNLGTVQEPPRTFQLAVNYRSHGGIVQCAHSVIELITEFWPYAIDVLSKERGVVDGSKPVFFSGWDSETVRYEQFLFGESGSSIEFGAQQCILVRDDAARDELRLQVGDIGLIMTLYESKGLEFDDVLLYKFFEHSTVDLSQWRVVLNLLQGQDGFDCAAPRFDDVKHAGVCTELKFLYVAITRARKNLWIVDCSEKSEPMRTLWTLKNQVQNCTPGTDVPRLAKSSSPEEWEKTGKTLFSNKRYLQAMHCFERAGLTREVAVSRTYYLREQARALPTHGSKQSIASRQRAFHVAADAFLQCASSSSNAKEKKAYLRSAGECFEYAEEDCKAAKAYTEALEFTSAVKLYRKCAKFDEAIEIVTQHRQHVDVTVAENIVDIARLFYFRGGELEKATQLFDSIEEQLEYLEDFDLDGSRADVLENLKRYKDAAEIHISEGRTFEAIRLLLMDKSDEIAIRRGNACILQGLWENVSFNVKPKAMGENATKLLELASQIKSSTALDESAADQLSMFGYIKDTNLPMLRGLGRKFAAVKDRTASLLCLDHYFQATPNLYLRDAADLSQWLEDFFVYCHLLYSMAVTPKPCIDPDAQKLFRVLPSGTDGVFLLPTNTFLHDQLQQNRALVGINESGISFRELALEQNFKKCLFKRISDRVVRENESCRQAKAFVPCLTFAMQGFCHRNDCPRRHSEPTTFTRDWYTLQVRIHLRQILIFHTIQPIPFNIDDRHKQFRYWIGRLYETLYPPTYLLGNYTQIDIDAMPEGRKAFDVVKTWAQQLFYHENQTRRTNSRLLTCVYQCTRICFMLEGNKARDYIHRTPTIVHFSKFPDFIRNPGAQGCSVVLDLVSSFSGTPLDVFRGVLFLKQLVDKMLPLEITALCDLIDYLCGATIIIRQSFNLHNITLPRSWFVMLYRTLQPQFTQLNIPAMINLLSTSLLQLLERLHQGNELQTAHLLYDSSDLGRLVAYRPIFIVRLCRALSLVGYNVNNPALRDQILRAMKLLKLSNRGPHALYREYANARWWGGISSALRKSTKGSPLDEMIVFYHESRKPINPYEHPDVRRVIFKDFSDIPGLLSSSKPPLASNLRADAPEFVPTAPKTGLNPAAEEVEEALEAEQEQTMEEPDIDTTDIVNTSTSIESVVVTGPPESDLPPSEQQNEAAKLIQMEFRNAVKRNRKTERTSLEASRVGFFDTCLVLSREMAWPNGNYYRMMYLGPLPHVLACLSAADSCAQDAKKRNKKRLNTAKHQELEDVMKRLTDQKNMIKEIKRLQKALYPAGEVHKKRDIEELKKLVVAVQTLFESIPNPSREVQDELAIGLRGIVAVKRLPKAKAKPIVCVDDDVEDGYDDVNSA